MKIRYLLITISTLAFVAPLSFAQTDHSGHTTDHSQQQAKPTYVAPEKQGELAKLPKMPASGEARESGYDGRYRMEPTSAGDKLQAQCAKGSRALVMLDNRTWEKCGGKPEGAAQGAATQTGNDHSGHAGH